MLKCVVFWVTPYFYGKLIYKLQQIRQKTSWAGIDVQIEQIFKEQSFIEWEGSFSFTYQENEILFITDSPAMLGELFDKGYYAIALFHENNKEQQFPQAVYAVEDVDQLECSSYEEAYRRLAGLPWDILETKRLKVRESTVEDVEDFYHIYEEPSITYYMENLFTEREEEKAYMKAYIKQIYGFYGFGLWTVIKKENGQVIGRAGLSVREGYDLPELGFVIDAGQQHKGYGYEVCNAILDYARDELKFSGIQALVEKENKASVCLLKKLGFFYDRHTVENGHNYLVFVKKI